MEIKKYLWWSIAALLGFATFFAINMPASSALKLLQPYGITVSQSSGSLWHGYAKGLRSKDVNIETLEWQIHPLPLLIGQLSSNFKAQLKDGVVIGNISRSLTGQTKIHELKATLPLETIIGGSEMLKGWDGLLQADIKQLTLKDDWPIAIEGTFDLIDLTEPKAASAIGSFRLSFHAATKNPTIVIGNFSDMEDASLGVSGTIRLASDRNYLLDLYFTPRDITPPSIMSRIKYLGPPDTQGRHLLSIAGTF